MKTVGVADFKEQCMELLDRLDDHGLVITKTESPLPGSFHIIMRAPNGGWRF